MRWHRWVLLCVLCNGLLLAQSWSTFFSAYEDGLGAQQRGDYVLAIRAFERSIALSPEPGQHVRTYGLNFLPTYYPYLHLAQSCLAQGDRVGAEHAIAQSIAHGKEPASEREILIARLRQFQPATQAGPQPDPVPSQEPPASPLKPFSKDEPLSQQSVPNHLSLGNQLSSKPLVEASVEETNTASKNGSSSPIPAAKTAQESIISTPQPSQSKPATQPSSTRDSLVEPPQKTDHRGYRLFGGITFFLATGAGLWWVRQNQKFRILKSPSSSRRTELQQKDLLSYGPYSVHRELGRGGCATAYYAIHQDTGAEVAIKVPHAHLLQDPAFRHRFSREASLGARLDHPHIVRILDPGPSEGDPWLAMSFIRGRTLAAHLAEAAPLPVDEAIRIASDIAEAMAYAHARSVVHRDLKPGNIMLNESGAIVMDFGVARILDASLTTSTLFIGTPAYSAPESLTNPQVGPPADRYALGIILFEMLMGRPPFSGESPFLVLDAHRSQPLPSLDVNLPPRLIRLVERLCAKNAEDRPEDGETLSILKELQP